MLITFSNQEGTITEQMDLAPDMDSSELKSLLEAIMDIPSNQQVFVSNGRELGTQGSLRSLGVKDNDFILVINSMPKPVVQAQNNLPTRNSNIENFNPANSNASNNNQPVYFEGMSVLDVLQNNRKPEHIVQIIQGNPNLLRELNFHNEKLAAIFRKDEKTATKELAKFLMLNSAMSAVGKIKYDDNEKQMRSRIEKNPNDEEAKKYFEDKERKMLINEQYTEVLRSYPESLTRVLMLYINVKINSVPIQAFVDSGAQTSVMSYACAKKVGLEKLIDERFGAAVVGVGTGRSLGRIHLADLEIERNFYPISLTVLDTEQGLGDKNMEFLLGLDMLKRHRCIIDLAKGVLRFQSFGEEGNVETPFLHEKDLGEEKGGTKGYDPNKKPTQNPENDKE